MEAIEKAAEIAEDRNNRRDAKNPELKRALDIVHGFLKKSKVVCYGGTAVNNLLPESSRFYNPATTIPDYDVFSETPQIDAIDVADALEDADVGQIEVRPGVHMGTFKIFANYIGVMDITFMDPDVFAKVWGDSIEKEGIHYANPNFLRMSMYLELSRPKGDVSRWTKVYKRLELLNDTYPIKCPRVGTTQPILEDHSELETFLEEHNVIVLGLHASQIHERKQRAWDLPIDLIARPKEVDTIVEDLADTLGGARVKRYKEIGEFLPPHVDLMKGKKLVARVFEAQACHSYHMLKDGTKIASIPTILQFFMAFMYADAHIKKELDQNRLLCIAQRLVDISRGERRKRRFAFLAPLDCLGDQETLTEVRIGKAKLYEELSKKGRESPEFLRYFFSYFPKNVTRTQRRALRRTLGKTYRKMRTERS